MKITRKLPDAIGCAVCFYLLDRFLWANGNPEALLVALGAGLGVLIAGVIGNPFLCAGIGGGIILASLIMDEIVKPTVVNGPHLGDVIGPAVVVIMFEGIKEIMVQWYQRRKSRSQQLQASRKSLLNALNVRQMGPGENPNGFNK